MNDDSSGARAPPRATYRLQFHNHFTLRDAIALVPYLSELGISHVYASPLTEARPGSTHGYDIVDHNRLNPEIGDDEDFALLVRAMRDRGMGLIIDIVPNHMGVGGDNAWWMDVLEWGSTSRYAHYFDINWHSARPDTKGRVLLPVLGDQYGVVLEAGQIELRFDPVQGSFGIGYFEHCFPLSPRSYATILAAAGPELHDWAREFAALRRLRTGDARPRAAALKGELAAASRRPRIVAAIEGALRAFAGEIGHPASFGRLHHLIDAQAYRLAYWRVAADEINYRRFFNINDLAGLRVELAELFDETHRMVLHLAKRGEINGLRIDHVDGLFDPHAYLTALRQRLPPGFYVTVEKILARYETLPKWPVDGSTGYDFLNQVLGLFVDPEGERAMTRLYQRLIGRTLEFDAILLASKQRIMGVNLASEMSVLAQRFHQLSMQQWRTRDFTLRGMRDALEEVISAFPVYRTYVTSRGASAEDRHYIAWAIAQARKRRRAIDTTIFDFIQQVLTGNLGRRRRSEFQRAAMQFQQVTSPVMAKASEDTAFYRYFRLLALNEVGGDPRRFGLSVAGFHHLMHERARDWPHAMSASATHDTKRGEDARIRLAMLSEMPRPWSQVVVRWLRINRSRRSEVDGDIVPDRNVEYLFYQTLVGVWPPGLEPSDSEGVNALAERVAAYMTKAVREGKEESSWSNPNEAYEAALERFVTTVLDASRPNAFLADFHDFIESIARLSAIASLAQLVLKLTAPGVPDIYQGCELWDFSLVDPDNRRLPDWNMRRSLLSAIADTKASNLAHDWRDGREKLFVTHRLLALRRRYPALFAEGEYLALRAAGTGENHLCAFARQGADATVVIAVPRLVHRLYRGGGTADWQNTELALPHRGEWLDIFTGRRHAECESLSVAELLRDFPVAALLCQSGTESSATDVH